MTTDAPIACLPSQNHTRGFYETIGHHAEASEAWRLAIDKIAATTGCPDRAIRAFLDGRHGKSFAHEAASALMGRLDLPAALDHAIWRWMERRTDARIEEEIGIPAGLPYLAAFVLMYQARLEIAAQQA